MHWSSLVDGTIQWDSDLTSHQASLDMLAGFRREAEARRLAEVEARKMRELEQLRIIEDQKRKAEELREQAR